MCGGKSTQQPSLSKAALNKGTWVDAEDMHIMYNIWHRLYRDKDGNVFRYCGYYPDLPKPKAWFFPDPDETETEQEPAKLIC